MEKRILLAFTLSFLVFVAYMRLFAPQRPEEIPVQYPETVEGEPAERPTQDRVDSERVSPRPDAPQLLAEVEEPIVADIRTAELEREITVDTSLYRAVLSNRGARLTSFVLKDHVDEEGAPYEMVAQEATRRLDLYPLDIDLDSEEQTARVMEALFEVSTSQKTVRDGESGGVEFLWADGRGLEVIKALRFKGGSYRIDVDVTVRQAGTELRKRILYGPGVGEESRTGTYVQPDKGIIKAGQGQELDFFDAGDVEDGVGASVGVGAIGVSSHYFTALMLPPPGSGYEARLSVNTLEPEDGESKPRDFITAALDVPNSPATFELYIGPKEHDRLARLRPGLEGPGLEYVIEYGSWLKYLALPLRKGLLWIHGFVGNYGWSIVLLTVLINVALIPLKHYSYVSMRKMQKLSPQIKKINERYKKLKPRDPKQQEKNKEVMALYKEHGVNPMSGCLPMLLMIPFFFAFYRLLMVSIELRHAPFALWIQDLSIYDPYFVLPILMGVTQIAIQKMSPQTSADPMQAKMMMFMPVMFIFILAWAPAGLVLYWFANNLVSIGQQTITNRWMKNGKQSGEAQKPGGGKSGKSKKKAGSRS
jgi:YidC/Oxa1 family membrane protein insertase